MRPACRCLLAMLHAAAAAISIIRTDAPDLGAAAKSA
jgi:hypothetical protein